MTSVGENTHAKFVDKIISKEYPYKRQVVDLTPFWEAYKFKDNISYLKLDDMTVLTSEIKYRDYVRGIAEMESRMTGVKYKTSLNKVQITDADMKAKYEELKDRFEQFVESRSAKYVDVLVEASAADRAALQKQFAQYTTDLAAAAAAAEPLSLDPRSQPTLPR